MRRNDLFNFYNFHFQRKKIKGMENFFEGDSYKRALIYKNLNAEEQKKFRELSMDKQISLLRVPLKKQNSIKKGNLDTYIAWYSLSNQERKDIKWEKKKEESKKEDVKYEKIKKIKEADKFFNYLLVKERNLMMRKKSISFSGMGSKSMVVFSKRVS
jgi:protease II